MNNLSERKPGEVLAEPKDSKLIEDIIQRMDGIDDDNKAERLENIRKSLRELEEIIQKIKNGPEDIPMEVLKGMTAILTHVDSYSILNVMNTLNKIDDSAKYLLKRCCDPEKAPDYFFNVELIQNGICSDIQRVLETMLATEALDNELSNQPEGASFNYLSVLFHELQKHRVEKKSEAFTRKMFQNELEKRLIKAILENRPDLETAIHFITYIKGLLHLLYNAMAGHYLMYLDPKTRIGLKETKLETIDNIIMILSSTLGGMYQIQKTKRWFKDL